MHFQLFFVFLMKVEEVKMNENHSQNATVCRIAFSCAEISEMLMKNLYFNLSPFLLSSEEEIRPLYFRQSVGLQKGVQDTTKNTLGSVYFLRKFVTSKNR